MKRYPSQYVKEKPCKHKHAMLKKTQNFTGDLNSAGKLSILIFVREFAPGLKPGLHEPQLSVEWSVILVSSIVVERRYCALQVSSVA